MRYAVPLPLILLISLVLPAFAQQEAKATVQLAESYLSPYAGEDATGDHVVALWQFDGDEAAKDLSGHGHDLRLQGAQFSPDGKFGGALETFPGWPVEDAPHRASAKVHPDLTPRGAFTVEMWIRPKPDMKGYPESFLLDNRYVDKTGMQLVLSAESGALRNLRMELGFGADTEVFASDRAPFEVDVWTHVAFTYDGAGTGSFFINGSLAGTRTAPGRKDVAPGVKDLMIGDRVGSYYHGFPGFIDQVRICKGALEFRPAAFLVPVQRKVFVRMEPEATISLDITNKLRTTVSGARAVFQITGMPPQTVELPDLGPGETHRAACRLDTTLRPDDYSLVATIQVPSDPPFTATERFLLTIVPRKLPNTMPVLMWGAGLKEIDRLKTSASPTPSAWARTTGHLGSESRRRDPSSEKGRGRPDRGHGQCPAQRDLLHRQPVSWPLGAGTRRVRAGETRRPAHRQGARRLRQRPGDPRVLLQRGRVGGTDLRRPPRPGIRADPHGSARRDSGLFPRA